MPLTFLVHGQSSQDYVQLRGKQFYYKGSNFSPMVLNYTCNNKQNISGGYTVISQDDYCVPPCGNLIADDMVVIKNYGFNAVRLMGFGVFNDTNVNKLSVRYSKMDGHTIVIPLQSPYTDHFNLIENAIDSIKASNTDIKVILVVVGGVTSTPKVEDIKDQYSEYLAALSTRFASNTTIMAYDLYNEPPESSLGYSKKEICEIESAWYDALKSNSKNQLITIGLNSSGVIQWDLKMLKYDFMSLHVYPRPDGCTNCEKSKIKYISSIIQRPWIIGETGMAGTNQPISCTNPPHELFGESSQKDFAKFSLETSLDCGASGYSWWNYREFRCFDICDNFGEDFYGLFTQRINDNEGNAKLVANYFKGHPVDTYTINPNNCLNFSGTDYYNPTGNAGYSVSGKVTLNGVPVMNAYIGATFYDKKTCETCYYVGSSTFSDENGNYTVYSSDAKNNIWQVLISYPGANVFKFPNSYPADTNQWDYNITGSVNADLQFIENSSDITVSNTIEIGSSINKAALNSITVNSLVVKGNGTIGGSATLRAGNEISFSTGFNAQKGSTVFVSTGPFTDCDAAEKKSAEPETQGLSNMNDSLQTESYHSIYPVPNQGIFTYYINTKESGKITLDILSIDGRKLSVMQLQKNYNYIDMSSQPKGLYILKCSSNKVLFIDKVIIK